MAITEPAKEYTLKDFVNDKNADEMTYRNFSVTKKMFNMEMVEVNVVTMYIDELKSICLKVTSFTPDEINEYKYHPDLLAYYLYKSTQLDFIILMCNGMVDPKDFDFKQGYLYLPKPQVLKNFLSDVHNSERVWLNNKRD